MRRAVYACAALAAFIAAYASALWLRPDITLGAGFLFGDEGNNLWLAAVAAAGGRIPLDAFTPYGPLNSWIYIAAASAGGNTPLTFRVLLLLLNAGAMLLLFAAFARYTRPGWAALWSIAAMTPVMLGLGPLLGGLTVAAYTGLDRVFLAAALLVWRAPDERSTSRSVAVGALVAACQWNRFGTAVLVLAGLLVADLIGRRRIRATLSMLAGAAVVELTLIVWAFATLPGWIAVDTIWPAYMLDTYQTLGPELRWPGVRHPPVLFGHYGPALAGALVTVAALWRRPVTSSQRLALALLAAYVIGAMSTFRADYHFRQFAWWLAAAGGFACADLRWNWRTMAVAISIPAWVVILRTLSVDGPEVRWIHTPNAGRIAVPALEHQRLEALDGFRRHAESNGRHLLVAPTAAGWHAAFGLPAAGRHAWFLRGHVRPMEEAAFLEAMNRFQAIAICPDRGGGLGQLLLREGAPIAAMFPAASRAVDCAVFERAP